MRADIRLQPVAAERTMADLARDRDIPMLEVRAMRHADTVGAIAAFHPEIIFTACFPYIVPDAVLALAPLGAYNLHPSLLPRLRGPEPLFWTFRLGSLAGVTLHRMTAKADAGDLVAQVPVVFPDGVSYAEAERIVANEGGRLMVEALGAVASGNLTMRPQDENQASYYPQPGEADFMVTPDWGARHAFNFIHAMAECGRPILRIGAEHFRVQSALAYRLGETIGEPYRLEGEIVLAQLMDGTLRVVHR